MDFLIKKNDRVDAIESRCQHCRKLLVLLQQRKDIRGTSK